MTVRGVGSKGSATGGGAEERGTLVVREEGASGELTATPLLMVGILMGPPPTDED